MKVGRTHLCRKKSPNTKWECFVVWCVLEHLNASFSLNLDRLEPTAKHVDSQSPDCMSLYPTHDEKDSILLAVIGVFIPYIR